MCNTHYFYCRTERMPPAAGLYTNWFTWVPKAPECLLTFPAVSYLHNDTTDLFTASSCDGRVWNWTCGNPIMRTQAFGQCDGGCIFCNSPLMELGDGNFAPAYVGSDVPHKYPRGLTKTGRGYAICPHGPLVAIAAEERGEFATVAIVLPGEKLFINARTKRAGKILLAARKGKCPGKPIPGREFQDSVSIVGDHPRRLVQWKNADNLGVRTGEPLILMFRMRQTELSALEFELMSREKDRHDPRP